MNKLRTYELTIKVRLCMKDESLLTAPGQLEALNDWQGTDGEWLKLESWTLTQS